MDIVINVQERTQKHQRIGGKWWFGAEEGEEPQLHRKHVTSNAQGVPTETVSRPVINLQ